MQFINEDIISTHKVDALCSNDVGVYALRTDKIHPVISGNKWFKLKFYLKEALQKQAKTVITFGGAYSNHIVATAYACKIAGLKCAGIIRGEEPIEYSHTLKDAISYGMQLYFVSRQNYKHKIIPPQLNATGNYFIPEGGYRPSVSAGMATLQYEKDTFDIVCCAIGTGTMMAGIINSKNPKAAIMGISVLKNNYELENEIHHLLIDKNEPIDIYHDYHFGGYAKYNIELIRFMNEFYLQTGIPTDFVYSGKLFYAVNDLVEKKYFKPGSNILVIHCGGLQGNLSLPKGTLIF